MPTLVGYLYNPHTKKTQRRDCAQITCYKDRKSTTKKTNCVYVPFC